MRSESWFFRIAARQLNDFSVVPVIQRGFGRVFDL